MVVRRQKARIVSTKERLILVLPFSFSVDEINLPKITGVFATEFFFIYKSFRRNYKAEICRILI